MYLKRAEDAREKYQVALTKWVSSLSLAELNAARQNKEPGTRGEAALSTLPKRPSNAYAIFFKEAVSRPDVLEKVDAAIKKNAGEGGHTARIGLLGKVTGAIWQSMSDKEKEVSFLYRLESFNIQSLTLNISLTSIRPHRRRNHTIRTLGRPLLLKKRPGPLPPEMNVKI